MKSNQDVKILAITGMTGSGKSAATEYLKSKGVPSIYFGGIIYKEMNEAGIEITPESQQKFREEIREREGKDFVVRRAIKQVHDLVNAGQKRIILDGLYSWTEYKVFKHEFPGEVILVAMVPPKRIRYERIGKRSDRPFSQEEANQRDWSEIENLEKGGPIALADYYIVNDSTEEETHGKIDEIVREIGFLG